MLNSNNNLLIRAKATTSDKFFDVEIIRFTLE
jgi:hypothetical protein